MIYDDFADKLKREYELFLFALSGRYLLLTSAGVEMTPLALRQLERSGALLQSTFLESAALRVAQFVAEYPSASAQERQSAFLREIERMTQVNIDSLIERMRGAAVNPTSVAAEMHGAMGLLLQRRMAQPEYRVPTKSGRSFEALGLMYAQARDFGYRIYLAGTLERIGQTDDLAQVQYADPNHADNGLTFSISGATAGYPSFASLEDTIFHYNAQAMVVPHVSP